MTIYLGEILGDGWVREPRLVMAKHLGRCLEREEKVIHISKDRLDNSITNLKILKTKPRMSKDNWEEEDAGSKL